MTLAPPNDDGGAAPGVFGQRGRGLATRVFTLVALVNTVTFAGAGLFLWERFADENRALVERLTEELIGTLRAAILPGGANVARILDWPGWVEVDDAFLVDANLVQRSDGSLQARGVALHPVGAQGRDSGFELETMLSFLALGIESGAPASVAGGRVVPIDVGGQVWGACWFKLPPRDGPGPALRLLLPWFLISTALLTGGGFLALRRLVLEPVERLASGALRMSEGDLGVEVEGTGRGDELDALVAAFNSMARRVGGFNRELERRVEAATGRVRRAEQAAMVQRRLAAMGELAAGIAHEINNPLGGLENAVVVLGRDDLEPQRRRRYLELLRDGLSRIGATVGQVLRMAPRDVRSSAVELSDVAEDALSLVRHRAEHQGVTLSVEGVGATGPMVHGSRNELGQALLNLLVNSLDALDSKAESGGCIRVRLGRPGPGRVSITVEDDGPGVDAETLERATDLFFSTKDPGRGTGLGLAIVYNVADSHGGTLALSSQQARSGESGGFFRAVIELPEHQPDDGAEETA